MRKHVRDTPCSKYCIVKQNSTNKDNCNLCSFRNTSLDFNQAWLRLHVLLNSFEKQRKQELKSVITLDISCCVFYNSFKSINVYVIKE